MDRRKFIKNASIITLPMILQSCDWLTATAPYEIAVDSDANTGHLLRKSQQFNKGNNLTTKTLIVGGGIAGLSAACSLRGEDFLLCELSDQLGGSSSSRNYQGLSFSQGAHYDLGYPEHYGAEVLHLLKDLDIISYHPWNKSWGFNDRQHIIFSRSKNQCSDHGVFRKDVLEAGKLKQDFYTLMMQYKEEMHLPTRLISPAHHALNDLTFYNYLRQHLTLTPEFIKALDYHMKDDYGAGIQTISALAGIHYFMCRPYLDQDVELFSPPEGNSYFIHKMAESLPKARLKVNQLVREIKETDKGFDVEVIDVAASRVDTISCNQIVYAGQKHALKFIYPSQAHYFTETTYSPWLVVNVILKDNLPKPAFWQNEMLTSDDTFMGFVDSATQQRTNKSNRTLTGYYCLPTKSRNDLIHVPANKNVIAQKTIAHMSDYFKMDISEDVVHVNIKVMGHAMPIPVPGFLLHDKNEIRSNPQIAYAGVDNGRLPLLYEALDSGIQAVKRLKTL